MWNLKKKKKEKFSRRADLVFSPHTHTRHTHKAKTHTNKGNVEFKVRNLCLIYFR